MPIPDYQTLMRPALELVIDTEQRIGSVIEAIGDKLSLSDEEREETIPSGRTTLLANRVHWAITYMVQAGLIERPRRGIVRATARGQEVYGRYTDRIDNNVLSQFAEFQEFKERSRTKKPEPASDNEPSEHDNPTVTETPEERIDSAIEEHMVALRDELLG